MDPQVARLLRSLRWPGVDAVTYGDGRMTLLEPDGVVEGRLRPLADTTLASYLAYHPDPDDLSGYDIAATVEHGDHGIAVGDGTWEGAGVVVVVDRVSGVLDRFAYLERSGAFVGATAADGVLRAVTAAGARWHVPVADPLAARVERPGGRLAATDN